MNAALILRLLYLIEIIEADPAILEVSDMIVVAVLVKSHQHVGLITGVENFPRAEMHLEN